MVKKQQIRKMPIGVQTFSEIVSGGNVYVDKTDLAWKLANDAKFVFLGRPRRFGKSLLISTLKFYFQGKSELFEGLKINDYEPTKEDEGWVEHPVIHLDFSGTESIDADNVRQVLSSQLNEYEKLWGFDNSNNPLGERFFLLIKQASEKFGQKTVVLIDEYDKPLLKKFEESGTESEDIKAVLKSFYGTLKRADEYIRFGMLTGVTKFSKVSVFSDLNQLKDISLNKKYATICGITQKELEENFDPEINEFADEEELQKDELLKKLKAHYNGYRFTKAKESVYNPFSTLNVLADKEFISYWYKSGTPTLLLNEIRTKHIDIEKYAEPIAISENSINDYQPGDDDITPLFFQSGYLTIVDYDSIIKSYMLDFPNEEVRYGFYNNLIDNFGANGQSVINKNLTILDFLQDLNKGDVESMMIRLQSLYAELPYSEANKYEGYYQAMFHILFTLMGQIVRSEVHFSKGRSDSIVETYDYVHIFEFKMDGKGTPDDALQQIDNKGYVDAYASDKRKVYKIGVSFDPKDRKITDWKIV